MNLIIYISKSTSVSAYTCKMRYSVYSRGIWISRPIPISTSSTSVKPQCHSLTQTPSCGSHIVNQRLKKINPRQSSRSNYNLWKWTSEKWRGKCRLLSRHASLLCPWNSPSKNTGVGSRFLFRWSSRPRDQT